MKIPKMNVEDCKGLEPGELVSLAQPSVSSLEVKIPRLIGADERNPNSNTIYEPESFKTAMERCIQLNKGVSLSIDKQHYIGWLIGYDEYNIIVHLVDEEFFSKIESPIALLDTYVDLTGSDTATILSIDHIHINSLESMPLEDKQLYEERLKTRKDKGAVK